MPKPVATIMFEFECEFCDSTDTAETVDYSVDPPQPAYVCWDHGRI